MAALEIRAAKQGDEGLILGFIRGLAEYEKLSHEVVATEAGLRETLANIIEIVWDSIERTGAKGRTVTLKMKFTDFRIVTRAHSLDHAVPDKAAFARIAHRLLEDLLPLPLPIRLMGLTLSNLDGDRPPDPPPDTAQLSLL